ncbi:MAG: hypothetical protein LQ338_001332 [Usnochroma carphineum]|nr:MAG: hypothetical protein LQ338_001332 [Usnochroma carphineum]
MSVGFGFSLGDFIAAIKIVETVIDALSASSKSTSELQELLRQLHSLETALRGVKSLEVHESLHAEVLALKQSAAQCQLTISNFLTKTASYQPHLLCTNGTGATLQGRLKKIKWALCKKKDVVQLKADLLAHTESIQLLLITIQMKNVDLGHGSQQSLQRSIASQIQASFSSCMRTLSVMKGTLTGVAKQAHECLENTRQIISMNLRVFQVLLDIQNILKTVPGQIERQQPVVLNDALGRYAPFHLEFIRSPEALISVLSINFRRIGSASEKIQKNEFTIHDSRSKKDIDLTRPLEECFRPGQHVEMSMVFDRFEASTRYCPGCRHQFRVNAGEDIEWFVASLSSRRVD